MTRSVYIVGGAASGKSTFMAALLEDIPLGPLEDLWSAPNSKGTRITLRGHRWPGGVYLGCMRPVHPGTDGLDRVSTVPGVDWLRHGELPPIILGEGTTLSTSSFLTALAEETDLLLVHLTASPEEIERRCLERGTTQSPLFLKNTTTRARNLAAALPCPVLPWADTELVAAHLGCRVG